MTTDNNLTRFIEAQNANDMYQLALKEITNGKKVWHWIWYIFPQLKQLGRSRRAVYYGIEDIEEARAYLSNAILCDRLYEISKALLLHEGKYPEQILGSIDAIKVRSCMTLFDFISPNDVFNEVLDTFYDGARCEETLKLLHSQI